MNHEAGELGLPHPLRKNAFFVLCIESSSYRQSQPPSIPTHAKRSQVRSVNDTLSRFLKGSSYFPRSDTVSAYTIIPPR